MDITTIIQIIALAFMGLVIVLSFQSILISRILKASFGWSETAGWILLLGLRLYGILRLSGAIMKAQATGQLPSSLGRDQWIGIIGGFAFMLIMIFSKDQQRRAIKKTLGI